MALLGASLGANAQVTNTGTMEVTTSVDSGCFLTAEDINFGILMMPLIDTNAKANINIKCSKGAN